MNKLILSLLLIFSLISLTSANVFINNSFEASQQVGELKTYEIKINNTNDFDVFNFNFGNLEEMGFSFGNTTIEKNTTKTVQLNITPLTDFSGILEEVVEFSFNVNIPTEITTYQVEIGDDSIGFSPKYLPLRVGDTIIFKNIDTIVHNIYSTEFNENLQPNQTFSYTPQSTGEISYIDSGWAGYVAYQGSISVIERNAQEEVHNPNLDFTWTVDLNFYPNPTTIIFELQDQNITAQVLKETEGSIKITNNGSEEARGVRLNSSSSWIIFEENNFDLPAGATNYVTFKAYPIVSSTNQTNKTHEIEISLSGLNIVKQTRKINLFVPFQEITGNLENDFDYANWLENVWCVKAPCSAQCYPELPICQADSNINNAGNQSIIFNGSVSDLTEMKRLLATYGTESNRNSNSINGIENFLSTYFPDLNKTISDAYLLSLKTEDKQKTSTTTYFIIIFFAFLFLFAWAIYSKYKKVKAREELTEGKFEYRK